MPIQSLLSGVRRIGLSLFLILPSVGVSQEAKAAPGVQPVERLVIRFHDGSFELVSRIAIQKVLLPTLVFADSSGGVTGTWFELQTSTGGVLYRRSLNPPQFVYVESVADSVTGEIIRQITPVSERTFSIVVPRRDDASQITFYQRLPGSNDKSIAAPVIGRIRLR